jgi:hypothetical protein
MSGLRRSDLFCRVTETLEAVVHDVGREIVDTVDRASQPQSMMRKYENSVCHIWCTRAGRGPASSQQMLVSNDRINHRYRMRMVDGSTAKPR